MTTATPAPNWFDRGGAAYALHRPDYPDALADALAERAPRRDCALDVGCGSGQFARLLANRFAHVTALDPSADQLAHATPHPRIRYVQAPAERLEVADGSAALVAAAQAAHWFDLPAFYAEVRRVAAPGAVVALVSYGVLRLDGGEGEADARFRRFYAGEIGPYWPPERRLVDEGYASIPFPFAEIPLPPLVIRRDWTLTELLGYIGTWSATRRAREAGAGALLDRFAADMAALWGDPATARPVTWPVNGRIGTV